MCVDLSESTVTLIGVVGTIVSAIITRVLNTRMKDKHAAAVLSAAIGTSLVILEQAAAGVARLSHPGMPIPGVPQPLTAGVQYVLDYAGEAVERLGMTPEAIAERISAEIAASPPSVCECGADFDPATSLKA